MAKNQEVTNYHKLLGVRIRKLRKLSLKTIEEVAWDAGIDFGYLGQIERGEVNTTVTTLCKIAQALNVSPKDLLPGK